MTPPGRKKQGKAGSGHAARSKPARNDARTAKQRDSGAEEQPGPGLFVGIGASAGGLDAFKAFFTNMPSDSGMAFMLVQHLSPDHKSMLADLLSKVTAMPVVEAEDAMTVTANRVYVIPPDATLTIKDRTLRVVKPAPPREHRKPIDTFFSSLAEEQGENAVCIVLSGTGSDGSLGLGKIKEHGGLTLAQAEFDHSAMDGMPRSAAATGLVDDIMPVEKMPARLVRHQQHLSHVAGRKDENGTLGDMEAHLATISALLRVKIGHDFSQYKEKTLVRRIQRRMQVLQTDTVPDYIARLNEEPGERELLFREFLIVVTQFFRDPHAFEALQASVIPKLLENKGADDQVRIWVPGCATGEEVYSIAILVKEEMERRGAALNVQIFGTDIDDRAVAIARAGRYRKPMTGVSPERTERWFTEEGDECCPIKAVREMCVFSTHSLIKDPPFSKLDLISCRNLLIYLDAALQDRVVQTFHYALRPGGRLFLGSSEGLSRNTRLFTALDKKHRIFERRDTDMVLPAFPPPPGPETRIPAPKAAARAATPGEDRIDRSARRALEKYSPVHVVVNEHHEILRFSGGEAGHYLEPSPGTASLNLFSILRKPLRPVVRAAMETMAAMKEPVVHDGVALRIEGKGRAVRVIVAPLTEAGADAGLRVIAFQDTGPVAAREDAKSGKKTVDSDVQALEQELHTTKAQLQAATDEFETVSEEMKSSNEEYQSVNEELQSSNEELETSKEEMQSVNEELQTINAEMSSKNELLTRLNSDIKNLFDSTEIATIFLDNDLRIKSFTPGMTDIFHLREADRGRPITEIVTLLTYADLERDARKVMRKLSVIEHEVEIAENRAAFIMRIRPYRTVDNVIDGVVVTFVEISERKKAAEAVREAKARLQFALDSAQVGEWDLDLINDTSRRSLRHDNAFGYSEPVQDWGFEKLIRHVHPEDRPEIERQFRDAVKEQKDWNVNCRVIWPDGSVHWIDVYGSIYRTEDGKPTHMLGIVADITERKQAEQYAGRLAAIVEASDDAIIGKDLNGVITSWNRGAERLFGYAAEEALGKPVTILIPPERHDEEPEILERVRRGEIIDHYESVHRRKDGGLVEVSLSVSPLKDGEGRVIGASKIVRDITERKQAEHYARRLAAIVEASDDAIISKDLNGVIASWNQGAERLFGYTAEEALGKPVTILIPPERHDEEPEILARIRRSEFIDHYESVRQRKDGSLIEVSLSISPLKDDEGRVIGASKIVRDITERKQTESQTALLMGELDHRVKNILAVVSSVILQTLKTSPSPGAFAASMEGRIEAIARAHSLLTQRDGRGEASLHDLITTELAPYTRGEGNVIIDGADVDVALTPKSGLALAMAIHELASNAAKYGALSVPGGNLTVTWESPADGESPTLNLAWTETGGPAVQPPSRRGFGTTLIERVMSHEFDATVKREFPPSGLRCTIEIPLTDEVGHVRVPNGDKGDAR